MGYTKMTKSDKFGDLNIYILSSNIEPDKFDNNKIVYFLKKKLRVKCCLLGKQNWEEEFIFLNY
jgi:hypothetical protein